MHKLPQVLDLFRRVAPSDQVVLLLDEVPELRKGDEHHLALPIGERTPAMLPQMIEDVRECVATLKADPSIKPTGTAAVYGAAATIPDAILEDVLRGYIDVKMKVKHKKA